MSAAPSPTFLLSTPQLRAAWRASVPPAASTADRLVALVEALDSAYDHPDLGLIVKVMGLDPDHAEFQMASVWPGSIYDELVGAEFVPGCEAVAIVVHGRARSMGDHQHAPGEVLGQAKVVFAVARDTTSVSLLRVDDSEPRVLVGDESDCVGRLADVVRRGFGLATAPPEIDVSELTWLVWLDRIQARVLAAETVDVELVESVYPELPSSWPRLIEECAAGCWPELRIHPELATWMDEGMFSRVCRQGFVEPVETMLELGEVLDRAVWLHLVKRLTE